MRATWRLTLAGVILPVAVLIFGGCKDDNETGGSGRTPTTAGSPTPSPNPLVPPLEGPPREPYIGERQDFRQNPDYQLPRPGGVPTPPAELEDSLIPPASPECPDEWEKLFRGPEGFQLCYPSDWSVLTDAYKNAPNEARWYAGGVFKFTGEGQDHQLAHVSIYVIPQYTRPFPYTKDCPTPYSVELDGQPGVLCPSFPASHPEARIISYHVFRENFDYFFNVALYYRWDQDKGKFTDKTDSEALETGLKIIHSVSFGDVPNLEAASPTASP
jgi:hypothetical protein